MNSGMPRTSTARSFPSLVLTIGGRLTSIFGCCWRSNPVASSYLRRASPAGRERGSEGRSTGRRLEKDPKATCRKRMMPMTSDLPTTRGGSTKRDGRGRDALCLATPNAKNSAASGGRQSLFALPGDPFSQAATTGRACGKRRLCLISERLEVVPPKIGLPSELW